MDGWNNAIVSFWGVETTYFHGQTDVGFVEGDFFLADCTMVNHHQTHHLGQYCLKISKHLTQTPENDRCDLKGISFS